MKDHALSWPHSIFGRNGVRPSTFSATQSVLHHSTTPKGNNEKHEEKTNPQSEIRIPQCCPAPPAPCTLYPQPWSLSTCYSTISPLPRK
jgi:hypothetical protein